MFKKSAYAVALAAGLTLTLPQLAHAEPVATPSKAPVASVKPVATATAKPAKVATPAPATKAAEPTKAATPASEATKAAPAAEPTKAVEPTKTAEPTEAAAKAAEPTPAAPATTEAPAPTAAPTPAVAPAPTAEPSVAPAPTASAPTRTEAGTRQIITDDYGRTVEGLAVYGADEGAGVTVHLLPNMGYDVMIVAEDGSTFDLGPVATNEYGDGVLLSTIPHDLPDGRYTVSAVAVEGADSVFQVFVKQNGQVIQTAEYWTFGGWDGVPPIPSIKNPVRPTDQGEYTIPGLTPGQEIYVDFGERDQDSRSMFVTVGADGVLRFRTPAGWPAGVVIDLAIADGAAVRSGGTEAFWGTSFMVTETGEVVPVKADGKKSDAKKDEKVDKKSTKKADKKGLAKTGF